MASKLSIEHGVVSLARQVPSPNHNARARGTAVSLLVVHGISLPPGQFTGRYIEDFFCNRLDVGVHPYFAQIKHLRVSSHLLIRRDGELVQFVNLNARAWHAGASSFQGREDCNDFSIGVELEGADDVAYADAQYEQLVRVAVAVMRAYPAIVPARICGHEDIAPGRKTDPGDAFDWARLRGSLDAATGARG